MKIPASLMILLWVSMSWAQDIRVAAAADLNPAAKEIAAACQKEKGIAAQISFGSSGNIFSQIRNGAPFDVFLSADIRYPQELVNAGLASQLTEYGSGTLVLWVSNRVGVDVKNGMNVLRDPKISRVSVSNPEHAPYGRAAIAALEHSGLKESVQAKLVFGENVGQAAQFAESGNAQAALIALSQAMMPAMQAAGKYVEVPRDSYPPLRQAGVVVNRTKLKDSAVKFLECLKTDTAKRIFRRYGFRTE